MSPPPSSDEKPESVMISHYITGTTKTQPELGSYLTEKSEFERLEKWIQGAGTPEDFPSSKKINIIRVLAFSYETAGQITRKDTYMVATFEDGDIYSKLVNPPDSSIRDFYPYDESMSKFVIMAMGTDNWRKMVKTKIL
ncbi:hypothetical protein D7Z26_21925 [Cohnella endophytica]|uniref:Uncharacterized protein n=1 Tax=Cohnella endophytica TaxID=2419778 RepID=A0A494XGZ9_9BACL|nr:hypothetical protein [Cohnella endophytica]RKP47876.1 hypothetical protein D7Z26_21925 [Cohnella endophytica]